MNVNQTTIAKLQDFESPLSCHRVPIVEDRAELQAAYERIRELESTLRFVHPLLFDYEHIANCVEDVLDPRVIS